jgi:uncharacterized delta-60 repeat protein
MSTLDTTFGSPNGYVRTFANTISNTFARVDTTTMTILSDGNILVGGTLSNNGGGDNNFYIAKYDPSGNLVLSFATGGIFYTQFPFFSRCFGRSLAIQADGKILFCGKNFDQDSIVVMRLLSDGSFDTATFGSGNGYVTTPATYFNTITDTYYLAEPQSILVQNDGKILVSGFVYNVLNTGSVYALVRYNPNGTYDASFGNNGAIAHNINPLYYQFANSMVIQSGGKIVLGGSSDFGGTDRHFSAARFNTDGSVDTTFGISGDGSIILPYFSTSPVNSYDEGKTIKIQTDGKLVLSGYSYDFIDPTYYFYIGIVRLSSNGEVDTSYGTNGYVRTSPNPPSFRPIITSMVLQPNDKVIICGWYETNSSSPSSVSTILLARYNMDGSLDPLFGVNNDGYIITQLVTPPEGVITGVVSLQTDGKIVAAGYTRILSDSPGIYSILVARYLYFADPDPVTPVVPICFVAGSEVLTDQGYIPIEKINPSIHTICHKKIIALTKTRTNETSIVCVEKNAFCDNVPNKRTLMSGEHSIFTKNKLIPVKEFVNKKSGVYFVKYNDEILYNILLDRHSIMNVNNIIVETLDPRNIVSKLYINNYSAKEKSEIVSKARDILSQRDTDNKFYLLNSKSTNPNTDTNNNDYTFKNFKKV